MKKLILILLVVLPAPMYAAEPLNTPALVEDEIKDPKIFNPRKGHSLVSFGFEGLKYPVPYEFSGKKSSFSPGDVELWGGRLGTGFEIYLGAGFNTVTKVEGYYMGTLFSKTLNGGPDSSDVDFAYTKKTGQIWGFDAGQSIGYLFDMKTKNPIMGNWSSLTMEPFIEAGIGWATAYNRLNYQYDTGPDVTAAREAYKAAIEDQLLNTRLGAGFNVTSSEGYFLYLKGTYNRYDITSRKIKGDSQPNGQPSTSLNASPKDVDIDAIWIYAIGGGYKF